MQLNKKEEIMAATLQDEINAKINKEKNEATIYRLQLSLIHLNLEQSALPERNEWKNLMSGQRKAEEKRAKTYKKTPERYYGH